MSVVVTEEFNVLVNSEKQIDTTQLNNEITYAACNDFWTRK
jgi:hypothetical protein